MSLRRPSPYLILSIGVAAISLAAIFFRLAEVPGLVAAAYRMVIASVLLLPLSIRALKLTPLRGQRLIYAVSSGVFLGAHFATWLSSLEFTSVAASVTLVTTQPLWIALFSWLFLKKPPGLLTIIGVVVATTGGVLVGLGDFGGGSAPVFGAALALLGALCAAAYYLLGKAAQAGGASLSAFIGVAYTVAALVLLPAPFMFGLDYGGYSLVSLGWIAMLALVPQLIGHTSVNYAMTRLEPTLVATLILLEPLGSGIMAYFLFSEIPSVLTFIGIVVLLAGVALTLYSSGEKDGQKPVASE